MAGNMDERVVSMEFDNKQFERNVKTSMKTIEDLKESLDFDETGESFDDFSKKCKKFGKENVFEDVDSSVSKLRKGIGLLGDSAGGLVSQFAEITKITAMFQMAEKAINSLKNSIKSFTLQPISQGFDKYTTKINSIKTISNATGLAADKVDESLERLNWFTDETSASFDSMVQNIGKFTSVGKGLDESITAMQGIAAWGYHSGASIQEQNRAMYNLSQALGTGSVKLIDWKSIENAGMATKEFKEQAIAAAEAAGTLKRKGDQLLTNTGGKAEEVTVENFNSTLSKGWFTSDVLMSTLEEYGKFADKVRKYQEEHPQYDLASQAMTAMDMERLDERTEMFKQNIDTIAKLTKKDAKALEAELEAISGEENYKKREAAMKRFVTSLGISEEKIKEINKIADPKARKKEIASLAKSLGVSADELTKILDGLAATEESLGEKAFKSSQQAKSFQEAIDATKDAVSTGWMKTFSYIFGGLDKSIELWSDVTEILWELFAAGASFRNNAFMHWAEEMNGWADLWNADEDKGPLGALRNIMNTIIELKEVLGQSFKDVFFPELAKVTGTINNGYDAQMAAKNGLKTSDQIKQWREGNLMGYRIKQVTTGIREFTAKINEFFTKAENLEKIRTIFTAIATAVQFAVNTVSSFFGAIGNFISKSGILQDILNVVSSIAQKVTEFFNRLNKSGFIQKVFTNISNTFVWLYNTLKRWIDEISQFLEETGIGPAIRDFFKGIEEFFLGGENDVDESGKKTESGFFRAFGWLDTVKQWIDSINLKDILTNIKDFITNFGELWAAFTGGLGGGELDKKGLKDSGLSKNLQDMITKAWDFGSKLSGVFGFIKGIVDKVVGWLESSGILPAIRNAWDWIKTFFGNIGLIWDIFVKGKKVDPKDLDDKQKGLVEGITNFLMKIKRAWEKVKSWFTTAWNWISEKWQMFTGWLESSGILPAIRNVWDKIKLFFGNFGEVWSAFKAALTGQKLDKKALKNSGMDEGLQGIIETVWGWGAGINSAINWVKETWNKITTWLETSGILPTLRGWWEGISGWFEEVSKDIQKKGFFGAVADFFTGLWNTITGLFGGGEIDEAMSGGGGGNGQGTEGGEQKKGFLAGIVDKLKAAFTNENGDFDLLQGISKGIVGLASEIGKMDWTSISKNIFGVVVDVINGLDDACGKLHIDNIVRVIQKFISAFTGVMIFKGVTSLFSTIRAIAKHGKDKSMLEQFTDLLKALGTALLEIGIAIALIAGSMWLISKIDPNRFGAAVGVVAGIAVVLMLFLVIAYAMTKTMGKDSNKLAKTFAAIGSMFIQIALAILIVVASIWLISLMLGKNGEISSKLWVAMGIVAGIMLVMAGIVTLIALLTKNVGATNLQIGIAVFLGIAVLIAVCVAAILLLQNVDPGKAFTVIGELAVLFLMITVVIVVLAKCVKKFNPKMIVGMIAMAAMLAICVAALYLLKDVQPGHLIETAEAIAVIILSMVAALVICGTMGTAILVGAGVFAGALLILAVALVAIAAMAVGVMNNCVSFMSSLAAMSNAAKLVDIEAIKTALGVLPIIFDALSAIVAVDTNPALLLVRAAWDVFDMLSLASVAAQLVDISQFEKIFGKDGEGGLLQSIQTGMTAITDTGWKASALGRNVETLAENLKLVGQAGADLAKDAGGKTLEAGIGIVKEKLNDINEIVQMAISMSTIGDEGKIDDQFLTNFATGVGNIGAALKLYNLALASFENDAANGAEGITESDIAPVDSAAISRALQSVMAVLGTVTFDEGKVGDIEKWAGLSSSADGGTLFALGLTNIATAMTAFAQSATDFNSENVDKAITSLDKLADIKGKFADTQPSEYKGMMDEVGLWGDGGDFKTAISGMGTAIAAFGTSVKDLPAGSVKKATEALDTLSVIYEKLKGSGTVESYIAKIGSLTIGGTETTTEDVKTTFEKFALGIAKLRDGLASFSNALTNEEIGYNAEAVSSAVAVLQDMANIETQLKSIKVDANFWHDLLFGENGIKKLGENMSTMSAHLATFSQQLSAEGGFDIDVDSDAWKNISGVIQFMANIQEQMNNLVWSTESLDSESGSYSTLSNAGYTIADLANGINKIREAMVEFNKAMQKQYTGEGGGNTYKLGEWIGSNWTNMMGVLNDLKQMTIDLKNAGLKEGAFYDLDHFAFDIKELVNELNGSKLTEFMNKLDVPDDPGSITSKFAAFSESIKALVDASATLHGKSINTDDVKSMSSIISTLMSIDTSSWNTEKLNVDAIALAAQFMSGFATRLTQVGTAEGEDSSTVSGAMDALLAVIEGYSESFLEKGKTAGEQYATGFNQGLESIDSGHLTPVIDMDETGAVTGGTGIVAVLSAMKYATSADIASLSERLTAIDNRFTTPISVDDAHTTALSNISTKLDALGDLATIKSDVNSLRTEVNNLKVYIWPNELVGAIAPAINRKLGFMMNQRP